MLIIDSRELSVIGHQIKVGNCTINGVKGYNLNIQLKFTNNEENGYLNLSAGFEKSSDIMNFISKEYVGIPFDVSDNSIFFEVYDTEKFLDTEIESEIVLKLKEIVDDKVEVYIEVNDELIKIKFEGYLDIINTYD